MIKLKPRKKRKKKDNKKLFVLAIKNKQGQVLDLLTSYNYSALMIEGMELAKEKKGRWTIYTSRGKEVDGGFTRLEEMENG